MNFFDAQSQLPELARHLANHEGLVIACYCAAWCDTCRGYRSGFEALAARMPEHVFLWIDIEENEALLDDEDVENFPTVLVQSSRGNVFYGPMLPHPEHLERLLRGVDAQSAVVEEGPGALRGLVAASAQ